MQNPLFIRKALSIFRADCLVAWRQIRKLFFVSTVALVSIFLIGILLSSVIDKSPVIDHMDSKTKLDQSGSIIFRGSFAYTGDLSPELIAYFTQTFQLDDIKLNSISELELSVKDNDAIFAIYLNEHNAIQFLYTNEAFFDKALFNGHLQFQLENDLPVDIQKLDADSKSFEVKAFIWVILMIGLAAPLKFTNLLVISDRTEHRLEEYLVHHRSVTPYLLGKSLSLSLIGLCSTLLLLFLVALALTTSLSVVLLNDPYLMDMASQKISNFNTSQHTSSFDDVMAILSLLSTIFISKQMFFLLLFYLLIIIAVSQVYLFIQLYLTKEVTASWLCSLIPYIMISIPFMVKQPSNLESIPYLNLYFYISTLIDGSVLNSNSSILLINLTATVFLFLLVNFGLRRKITSNFSDFKS
jgi:hypothetical protein